MLLSGGVGELQFAFAGGESEQEEAQWMSRWDAEGLTTMQRTMS